MVEALANFFEVVSQPDGYIKLTLIDQFSATPFNQTVGDAWELRFQKW